VRIRQVRGRCVALLVTLLGAGCSGTGPTEPARSPEPASSPEASGGPIELGAGLAASGTEGRAPERGWLGVELGAVLPGQPGVLVRAVVPRSPAARAGISSGDVILSVEGELVNAPPELVSRIGARKAGDRVALVFTRGSTQRLVSALLEPLPTEDAVLRQSYVGAPAPSFESLKAVQGSSALDLGSLRGKVVVLEFWASWCGVCPMLVPVLNDWHARYGAQGVEVIGVTAEPVGLASRAAYQLGAEYAIAADDTGRTSRAYRALAIPTVFVIDRRGTVRDVAVGYSRSRLSELDQLISDLVATRPD
jgi:thiol-disulfide isomerase/thioredoxin